MTLFVIITTRVIPSKTALVIVLKHICVINLLLIFFFLNYIIAKNNNTLYIRKSFKLFYVYKSSFFKIHSYMLRQ